MGFIEDYFKGVGNNIQTQGLSGIFYNPQASSGGLSYNNSYQNQLVGTVLAAETNPTLSNLVSTNPNLNPYAGNIVTGGTNTGATNNATTTDKTGQNLSQQTTGGNNTNLGTDPNLAAQLASLNTGYDYYQAKGEEQIPFLSGQRDTAIQSVNDVLSQAQTSADSAKLSAEQNNQNETNKSLSTAQDVQKSNRNVLRSLGILDSTAAGEALQKPMNEFAKQRFQLGQALTTRLNDIQTFLQQKQTEAATAVKSIQDNYAQLISNIQTDLRFNEKQRADAITQATAAAKERLEKIATDAATIKSGADTATQSLKASIFSMVYAAEPTSDPAKINQMKLAVDDIFNSITGKQVGIAQGETDMYGNPIKKQTQPTALSQYGGMTSLLNQPNYLLGAYK